MSITAPDMGRVAVLYGGWSAEREVSLQSGAQAHAALQSLSVNAELLDATPNNVLSLAAAGFDRVFIALHGRGGEDGQVQAALELQQLPYTGCGMAASALAMNKVQTKKVWQSSGLPTPASLVLAAGFDADAVIADLGLPIFVKPASEGSSIGMSKVTQADQLLVAWQAAAKFDAQVLAEQYIQGREYTAAVLNGVALPIVRVEPQADFYDYHAKYQSEDTGYFCPCGLSSEQEEACQQLALQAFSAVEVNGWGRVDFFIDEQGKLWLLEINTVPGLTTHSLVPMAARAAGMSFEQLIWNILLTSCKEGA
ncbi:MAG: D-alanine--D-alanine ligase [Oceanococcus sp.]